MMMGSERHQSSPLCIIESYYTDIARGEAHSLSIVLPEGLVKQSACLLAAELAPYSLVPVRLHVDDDLLPAKGCINIMNDTVCKLLLVAKAERKKGGAQALDEAPIQHIFDEVDTLANPMSSELNVPVECGLGFDVCSRVVPLSVLFRIIYNTMCRKQSDLDLTEFPDVTLPKAVLDEFVSMNAVVANLVHRQHFGLGSREEYESAGMKMGYLSIPFTYADHPAMGAKFINTVFSMCTTAMCYICGADIQVADIKDMLNHTRSTARPAMLSECDAPKEMTPLQSKLVDLLGPGTCSSQMTSSPTVVVHCYGSSSL
jgi:hypothetical protein